MDVLEASRQPAPASVVPCPAPCSTPCPASCQALCPACAAVLPTSRRRHACPSCGTVWVPARRGFAHGASPLPRARNEVAVARCEQVTLAHWLRRTGVRVPGRRVLEVGFGTAATLRWLQQRGADVAGQEPVAANRHAAAQAGVPTGNLAADLGAFHGRRFDLALYLNAFEHLPDPAAHLQALGGLTARGAQALVVLPVADSLSRRLMGRAWPHEGADRWVFYSTAGLASLWERFGWRLVQRFYPWKYFGTPAIARRLEHRFGLAFPAPLAHAGLWLNIGERGLLFERA